MQSPFGTSMQSPFGTSMQSAMVQVCSLPWYKYAVCHGTSMQSAMVQVCSLPWYKYAVCHGTSMQSVCTRRVRQRDRYHGRLILRRRRRMRQTRAMSRVVTMRRATHGTMTHAIDTVGGALPGERREQLPVTRAFVNEPYTGCNTGTGQGCIFVEVFCFTTK